LHSSASYSDGIVYSKDLSSASDSVRAYQFFDTFRRDLNFGYNIVDGISTHVLSACIYIVARKVYESVVFRSIEILSELIY